MIKKYNVKNILKFTLPSMSTLIFIAIYVVVDAIIVSNYINETALASINIVLPIGSFVLAIGLMLGAGGNAICSKLLGEGKDEEAKQKLTLFVITGIILGVITTILIQIFIEPIIRALGLNDETYQYGYEYIKILSIFFPLLILQTIFQSIMVSVGKSFMFLISMIIGGVSRIVFSYILITSFNLGIVGSAIGAIISYTIPTVISAIYLCGRKKRVLHFVKPKMDIKAILDACANGSSEMVTNLSSAVTTFLFNQAMLDLVGNDGVAAITVILNIQFLLSSLFMGYSIGVSSLIGFSYGRKQKENLQKIFRNSLKIIIVMSVISLISSIVFRETLASVFTEKGTEVYNLAIQGLSIFSLSFLFIGINVFASGMFTAYSNGKVSAIISFVRTIGLISISILVLPKFFGIIGVWVAVPFAEFVAVFISIFFFVRYKEKYMYSKDNNVINESLQLEKALELELDEKKELVKENIIITISREFGSGGKEVAKRLSDKLDIAFYDSKVINQLLMEKGLSEEVINDFDYKKFSTNFNFNFASSFRDYKENISNKVFEEQSDLILNLAKKESGIFVGRCSDFILSEMNPFKIYIYSSDIDFKIDRCLEKEKNKEEENKSRKEILKSINEIDKKRKEYYEYYTDNDWKNNSNYNICIDVSKFGIKNTVNIIARFN